MAKDSVLAFRTRAKRNALAEEHWPWVRRLAAMVAAQLPTWFSASDLEGAAAIALVKAASRYDVSVGTTFQQFARRRIVGACYDAARRNEYRERGHAQLNRESIDEGDHTPDLTPSPEILAIDSQMARMARERIAAGVARLPARHRLVIEQIYYQGRKLEEMAGEHGVGPSRLCQIHREALGILKGVCAPPEAA